MRNFIESITASARAYEDYVTEDNGDYCAAYDVCLADDSAYHQEQWESAILSALDLESIEPDIMDQIIDNIITNPAGYCNNEIKRGYFWSDPLCIAAFPIGELELYEQWHSDFAVGISAYLNRHSDYYFTACGDAISCYINLSDSSVAYVLRPADIKELYQECQPCEKQFY